MQPIKPISKERQHISLFVFMWMFAYIKTELHKLYLIRSHIHLL